MILLFCGHKTEWCCARCGKCSLCCSCAEPVQPVHTNSAAGQMAIFTSVRKARQQAKPS